MDLLVLRSITYGMYALGVINGQTPTGCIVNTAFQITSENPVIAVSLNKNNFTHAILRQSGQFSLSILGEQTDQQIIGTLGYRSGRDIQKFETVPYELFQGLPVLSECCGKMALSVIGSADMETHTVFFGRLTDAKAGTGTPMTYAYYHAVRKGVAPKNAPTYQAQ